MRKCNLLVAAMAVIAACASTQASIIASESFDYADGPAVGQGAAADGWGDAWLGGLSNSSRYSINTGRLEANPSGWNNKIERPLDANHAGPVYFAYELSADFGNRGNHTLFLGTTSAQEKFMVKISNWGGNPNGNVNTVGDQPSGSNSNQPMSLSPFPPLDDPANTYLVVGRVEFDVNGADEDRITVWIDPIDDEGASQVAGQLTRESGISFINNVRFQAWEDNSGTNDYWWADNLRLAEDWQSLAIPEPATLALLGLGLAALVRRRR